MRYNNIHYYNYYIWKRHYLLSLALIVDLSEKSALKRKKHIKKRQMWVRDIFKKRREQGDFTNLVREMRLGDQGRHFNYFRMSPEKFDALLQKVSDSITKQNTVRESISPGERLALTLR